MMSELTKRMLLNERPVIVGLTSTAARLIGLCKRDKREDLIDKAADKLDLAIDGLQDFGAIAGCDSGTEHTTIALRQIVGWMRARDYEGAMAALHERYSSEDGFCESMATAIKEQGYHI
jgi:hypothetical protein